MFRDLTPSAINMGLLAAFVGYAASFAIVLAGLTAAGATPAQAATGLFFAGAGMGVCSILLPAITRTPAAVAWSTPGAAFLASSAVLPGGFAEAVGAMILCAGLIVLTGVLPFLARLVGAIPKPVANALLAGVLLKLCFAPALALGSIPLLVLPVLVAWLLGLSWNKLAAMPAAVVALVIVLYLSSGEAIGEAEISVALPAFEFVAPVFTGQAFISVALPLYLVTMGGQNVPGFAVLELHKYKVNRPSLLRSTGIGSLAIAPFGGIPVNMSAISAAMMTGEDAGKDPAKRYWAAMVCGAFYIVISLGAGAITQVVSLSPQGLLTAVAGLALIPALIGSLTAAFQEPTQLEAPGLTFLIAASGMTLIGISGAFWGLVAGVVVWLVKGAVQRRRG